MLSEPAECIDIAIVRVEEPIVGPGDRTSVRVHILNSGTTTAYSVAIALTDGAERGSSGVVMRQLGDMPPASIKSTTLSLPYAIGEQDRLDALIVAVYIRSDLLDEDAGVRRSSAWPEPPRPVTSRSVRGAQR